MRVGYAYSRVQQHKSCGYWWAEKMSLSNRESRNQMQDLGINQTKKTERDKVLLLLLSGKSFHKNGYGGY